MMSWIARAWVSGSGFGNKQRDRGRRVGPQSDRVGETRRGSGRESHIGKGPAAVRRKSWGCWVAGARRPGVAVDFGRSLDLARGNGSAHRDRRWIRPAKWAVRGQRTGSYRVGDHEMALATGSARESSTLERNQPESAMTTGVAGAATHPAINWRNDLR